jgi:hypothetical protein
MIISNTCNTMLLSNYVLFILHLFLSTSCLSMLIGLLFLIIGDWTKIAGGMRNIRSLYQRRPSAAEQLGSRSRRSRSRSTLEGVGAGAGAGAGVGARGGGGAGGVGAGGRGGVGGRRRRRQQQGFPLPLVHRVSSCNVPRASFSDQYLLRDVRWFDPLGKGK